MFVSFIFEFHMRALELGCRVNSKGDKGTVRYIGPVVTSKKAEDVWVGIEWDDATRGKHNGAVANKETVSGL